MPSAVKESIKYFSDNSVRFTQGIPSNHEWLSTILIPGKGEFLNTLWNNPMDSTEQRIGRFRNMVQDGGATFYSFYENLLGNPGIPFLKPYTVKT